MQKSNDLLLIMVKELSDQIKVLISFIVDLYDKNKEVSTNSKNVIINKIKNVSYENLW